MANFKVTLNIGTSDEVVEVIEIPDEDLEGQQGDERAKVLDTWWKEWAFNFIDGSIDELESEATHD